MPEPKQVIEEQQNQIATLTEENNELKEQVSRAKRDCAFQKYQTIKQELLTKYVHE